MENLFDGSPDDLIRPEELAKLLNKKPSTLADWRRRGAGPPHYACGRPLYRRGDVITWLESRRVTSSQQARRLGQQAPGSRSKRATGREPAVSASENASGTPKASPSNEGEGR
jgi:hypothetical protein